MKEVKKYFLKDEAITIREEDYFKHEDIADNIVNIIKTQETPYNIALIGKWGTGKSSIVELVKRKLNNPKEYKFAEINAWKYEKVELRRALLKQVFEAIDGKKEKEIIKEQLNNLNNITIEEERKENNNNVENKLEKIKKNLLNLAKPILKLGVQALLVFLVITFIYFVGYFILSLIKGEDIILIEYINDYIKSDFISKAIISFIAPIIKEFIDAYKTKGFNFWKIMYPKAGTDEYEELLKNHLKSLKKRVIVIIDDIDRLTTPKIVEALDAIKAFSEFSKIAFIVPFDDSVLKKALQASEKEYQVDTQMVESELFLDKLFQFKIYMPPLPEYDIREYTHKLCERECTELINICGENFDEIIDEILIHPSVNNPRQVKKILNNFLNNYLIAKKREDIKIEKGLLTDKRGIKVIAKLSVLQCDFNEFYDKLVDDFDLEKNLLDFYNDKNKEKEIPYTLRSIDNYFEGNKLKEKYLPLINYLILTSTIKVDNLAPYIYMAQDRLGIEMGDKKQREIKEALESKNNIRMSEIIEDDVKNAQKVVKYQLEINKLNVNILNTIVNCLHLFSIEFLEEICSDLIKKLYMAYENEKISNYLEYDVDNVILLYKISNKSDLLNGFINNIINKVLLDETSKEEKNKIMSCLLKNEKELTIDLKSTLKQVIERIFALSVKNYQIEDFVEYIDEKEFDIEYYIKEDEYNKLCKYIEEQEYYNQKALNLVVRSADVLIQNHAYDSCLQPINQWINIENLVETIEKIVIKIGNKATAEMSNKIISNIKVELLKDKIENITNIIGNLNYQITEKNKDVMDKIFTDIENETYITSIIKRICKNNQMQYLENLSRNISDQLLTDDTYHLIINEILMSYSTTQLSYINNLIKPLYSSVNGIETKNIERVIQISKALIKNNLMIDNMKKNLKVGVTTIKGYYNHKEWANWMSEIIGQNINILDDIDRNAYIELICKLLKDDTYQEFSLRAVEYMSDKLDEKNVDVIIKTIFEQNIDLVINRSIVDKLMSKATTDYYPEYINILVKQINDNNYSEIDSILDNHVDNIEEIEYIKKFDILENNNLEKISNIISKLYIMDKKNGKSSIIVKLLNNCMNFEKLLIAGSKIFNNIEDLNELQLSDLNSGRALNNYLRIMLKYNAEKKKIHEIIIYLLQNIEEVNIKETLDIIENIDRKYYPFRREKIYLSDELYNIFTETTSKDNKEKICLIIKKLGMRDQFLRKDFNEEDKEILKLI